MRAPLMLGMVALFVVVATLPALASEPTRLALSETVERELENDRFTAQLEARAEADDPRAAQAELNAGMAAALETSATAAAVEARTGAYNVRPSAPHDDEQQRWVATQDLRLDSLEREALLTLVGLLQEQGLIVNGLGAELTDERRRSVRDELTSEALTTLGSRAADAAAALGLTHDGWFELSIDVGHPGPRPVFAEAAAFDARAAAAPPVMTVGTTTVRLSVFATARLVP